MPVAAVSRAVDSATLARVREVTPLRYFKAQNDDEEKEATIVFNIEKDSLFCAVCERSDDCTHTARVRLCGILTGSIRWERAR